MKKKILVVLAILLFGVAVAFAGTATKTISDKGLGFTVTVPELAPEFFNWDTAVAAAETYANGNSLLILHSVSPDKRIQIISLWGKQNGKLLLLAFAAFYEAKSKVGPDIYEDRGFIRDGKSTGVFVCVDKASPTAAFKLHLYKINI